MNTHTLPAETFPKLVEFWNHWNGLPKGELFPALSSYLDAAPFRLQPAVIILDVRSPRDAYVRLFGTALTEMFGYDVTGRSIYSSYSREDEVRAGNVVWTALTHPCGYLCRRDMQTKSGRELSVPAITLPLESDIPGTKIAISYSDLDNATGVKPEGANVTVIKLLSDVRWIDLGRGVPAIAF